MGSPAEIHPAQARFAELTAVLGKLTAIAVAADQGEYVSETSSALDDERELVRQQIAAFDVCLEKWCEAVAGKKDATLDDVQIRLIADLQGLTVLPDLRSDVATSYRAAAGF